MKGRPLTKQRKYREVLSALRLMRGAGSVLRPDRLLERRIDSWLAKQVKGSN